MRRVARPSFCGACKRGAAAKLADGYGRAPSPLFRVWREYRDVSWPKLLDFWGLRNLQVINRDVHVAKCANEARDRRAAPSPEAEQADREPAVAHVRPRRCVGDYGRRPNCSATSFSASKIAKDRLNAASAS